MPHTLRKEVVWGTGGSRDL